MLRLELPIHGDIDECSLIARCEESLTIVFAASHVILTAIGQNSMMQPHACVGIRNGAIGVHQVGLEPCDETIVTWHCRISVHKIFHTIVDVAWWNLIRTILYPDPLRLVFVKILRLKVFYIWVIGDYVVYHQYILRIWTMVEDLTWKSLMTFPGRRPESNS